MAERSRISWTCDRARFEYEALVDDIREHRADLEDQMRLGTIGVITAGELIITDPRIRRAADLFEAYAMGLVYAQPE